MIKISEPAISKIESIMEQEGVKDRALRISIRGRARGSFIYSMGFVPPEEKSPNDIVVEKSALKVLIDPESAENMDGATLDYVEEAESSGFKIDNPNPLWKDPIALSVQEVLDERINPGIAMHGGFVNLLKVSDGIAYITMGGGCQGCSHANTTVVEGVDVMIREAVPEIKEVVDTTNHDMGTNPYYR